MSLPAKKITEQENIEQNETEHSNAKDNGRFSFRNAQHSRFGRSSSMPLNLSGQFGPHQLTPELNSETCNLKQQIKIARARQQDDLAMLRHAFRCFLLKKQNNDDDNSENKNDNANDIFNNDNNNNRFSENYNYNTNLLRSVSSSELNQLVSAVVRMHDDERELLGINPPDDKDNDDEEYKQLEQLSVSQLIELCYKEGIAPPALCKTQDQKENNDSSGKERPLGLPD